MADLTDVIIDGDPYEEIEGGELNPTFTGATANADGEQGDVPKPLAGQQNATLFGDGSWKTLLYDALSRYEDPDTGRSYTYSGDLNDITQNCIVNTNGNNANLPPNMTNWGFVITLVHSNQAGYASQIYVTMNIDGTKRSVWFRDKDNGTWRDWKTFATASNLPTSGSSYLAGDGTWKSDTANLVTNYTTQDDDSTADIITLSGGETAISTLESGANHARLFNKISRCFLNVRKLINTVKRIWQTVANAWVSGANYSVGQVVTYTNGHTYICKLAHTSSSSITPTNTTYWDDNTIGDMIYSLNSKITIFSVPISMYMHDQWVTLTLKPYGTYVVIYGVLSYENIGGNYLGIITAPKNSSQSAVVTDITSNRSDAGLEYNWNNGLSLGIHAKSTSWGMLKVIQIYV